MKKMSIFQSFAAMILALGLQASALAHTAMTGSVPPADSTVSSPSVMMLSFGAEVRLVRLSLNGSNGEVDIGFSPVATASTSFHVPMPFLQAGAYTVNWTAIGNDGHSVSNTFAFTVDPNAPAAVMDHGQMSHGDAHDESHGHDEAHDH